MKQLSFLLIAILVIGSAFTLAERTFSITFTESSLNKHWTKLNAIKQIVDGSNLPHQQAKFITATVDSLEMEIAAQVQSQVKAADTTKPKK